MLEHVFIGQRPHANVVHEPRIYRADQSNSGALPQCLELLGLRAIAEARKPPARATDPGMLDRGAGQCPCIRGAEFDAFAIVEEIDGAREVEPRLAPDPPPRRDDELAVGDAPELFDQPHRLWKRIGLAL